jgi:hypothetical protein
MKEYNIYNIDGEVRIVYENYIVHYIKRNFNEVCFSVFEILQYYDTKNETSGFSYIDINEGINRQYDKFEIGKCFSKYSGCITYSGNFEERIYFNGEEYFGHELRDFYELYRENILPYSQKQILTSEIPF